MTDDSSDERRGAPLQFSLWQLLWLVALCAVVFATIRGLGGDGVSVAAAALIGAVLGQAFGGSIKHGALRGFGAIAGGAIGGVVGVGFRPPWELPLGLLVGLAIGGCWLLVSTRIHPLRRRIRPTETSPADHGAIVERIRQTRRELLRAALLVAIIGLGIGAILGVIAFVTSHPLDRWFNAVRVVLVAVVVAVLVAITLVAVSSLLGLVSRRSRQTDGNQQRDKRDLR